MQESKVLVADISGYTGHIGVGSAILAGVEWQVLAKAYGFEGVRVHVPPTSSDNDSSLQIWSSLDGVTVTKNAVSKAAFWPHTSQVSMLNLDTTLRLQQLHAQFSIHPHIAFASDVLIRARRFVSERVAGKRGVALHLKQVGSDPRKSNADLDEWHDFLKSVAGEYVFFLLGQDQLRNAFNDLPHLVRRIDLPLVDQLAIIQTCDAFMGMSSGLCNVAIMSGKPYVVFKHPDHHAIKMKQELHGGNSFPFSVTGQLFLMQIADKDTLHRYFKVVARSLC